MKAKKATKSSKSTKATKVVPVINVFEAGAKVQFKRGNKWVSGLVKSATTKAVQIETEQFGIHTRRPNEVRFAGSKASAQVTAKLATPAGVKSSGRKVATEATSAKKSSAEKAPEGTLTPRQLAAQKAWVTIRAKKAAAARA